MDETIEKEIRQQLEKQFQRGMYTAAYGLSGAINDMIGNFKSKPKKRLADYQKLVADISALCKTKLNNPVQEGDSK